MKISFLKQLIVICLIPISYAMQSQNVYKDQFAHTYSIVARDTVTGEMAVGVQSHWFSVGNLVSWGQSGVGVVATQSFVNPAFGPEGLALMEKGISATDALQQLITKDDGKAYRQVAFLDATGNVSAYTGDNCVDAAHHIVGNNFSVQANMMLNDQVVPAMAEAYKNHSDLPLGERVLKTLQTAQKTGGDIRGKQSAALIVVNAKPAKNSWQDKKINLRVDNHKNPLEELERLLKVHTAYEYMNQGDLDIEHGDMDKAMQSYGAAEKLFPENLEMKYWKAVAMANNKQLEAALPIFKSIFEQDDNWRILTKRLPKAGLLTISDEELKKILDV